MRGSKIIKIKINKKLLNILDVDVELKRNSSAFFSNNSGFSHPFPFLKGRFSLEIMGLMRWGPDHMNWSPDHHELESWPS